MATNTPNLGLIKPAYEENADVGDINKNMDTLDAAIHKITYSVSAPSSPKEGDIWLKPI